LKRRNYEYLYNSNFIEPNSGPRFDKFGHIIKRSIVGSPDLFDKVNA
jgi:hypothetical protein